MDIDAKLRPLYLLKILKEQTGEDHKLSTSQLCQILKDEYGLDTFRTTIKTDIEVLQQAGYLIQVTRSTQNLYSFQEREFNQQEIKTLLDAVHSGGFVKGSDRDQLINKLYKLAGPYRAHELKRNWIEQKNSLADDPRLVRFMDVINEAINKHQKIRFRTFTYNVKKDPVPNQQDCIMSPCALFMDGGHACVSGYGDDGRSIVRQRIDRIWEIPEVTGDAVSFGGDSDVYRPLPFNAQDSEIREVEMQVDNSLMDEIIDVFGLNVTTYACDQSSFRVITNVCMNQSFYGWIFSFGGRIKIRGPECIRLGYEQSVRNAAARLGST